MVSIRSESSTMQRFGPDATTTPYWSLQSDTPKLELYIAPLIYQTLISYTSWKLLSEQHLKKHVTSHQQTFCDNLLYNFDHALNIYRNLVTVNQIGKQYGESPNNYFWSLIT